MVLRELLKQIPTLRMRGIDILRNPNTNKGVSFSLRERQILGIHGLLPPKTLSQEEEVKRCVNNLYQLDNDLSRYNHLMSLQDINEKLFFKTIRNHLNYCLPLISSPTISESCREFGLTLLRPRGLYLSIHDRGHILQMLSNWPEKRVKAICLTDGESILGIGDYGASGMGMTISKITLYTVLAGLQPRHCLPICLDVGTNNEELLNSEYYGGLKQPRLKGDEYMSFVDEVLTAFKARYGPNVCLHFTDFNRENTFLLHDKYKDNYVSFFDDIEAASANILAGIMSAARARKSKLSENRYLFVGAGAVSFTIGVLNVLKKPTLSTARQLVNAMKMEGLSDDKAHSLIYMMDSKGLLTDERSSGVIDDRKKPFTRLDLSPMDNLDEVIRAVRPTMLIGASSKYKSFTREILRDMAMFNKKPVIMALSDPQELAECTADLAYKATECRCIFVSGSSNSPVMTPDGREFLPSQSSTNYTAPGLVLALTTFGMHKITDEIIINIAQTVSNMVTDAELEKGSMYPPIAALPKISHEIALNLMNIAYTQDLASYYPEPKDKDKFLKARQYMMEYLDYTPDNFPWPQDVSIPK